MRILHNFSSHVVDFVVATALKASFCRRGRRAKVQYNNKLGTYILVVCG